MCLHDIKCMYRGEMLQHLGWVDTFMVCCYIYGFTSVWMRSYQFIIQQCIYITIVFYTIIFNNCNNSCVFYSTLYLCLFFIRIFFIRLPLWHVNNGVYLSSHGKMEEESMRNNNVSDWCSQLLVKETLVSSVAFYSSGVNQVSASWWMLGLPVCDFNLSWPIYAIWWHRSK